ncbi:hypothetical protein fHeYen902_193 [Yersinia phage fHe-Yen9-02]|nr:hypothetical protein fHeYen902_193 [Yersinia phage fHe-Yen9-02]
MPLIAPHKLNQALGSSGAFILTLRGSVPNNMRGYIVDNVELSLLTALASSRMNAAYQGEEQRIRSIVELTTYIRMEIGGPLPMTEESASLLNGIYDDLFCQSADIVMTLNHRLMLLDGLFEQRVRDKIGQGYLRPHLLAFDQLEELGFYRMLNVNSPGLYAIPYYLKSFIHDSYPLMSETGEVSSLTMTDIVTTKIESHMPVYVYARGEMPLTIKINYIGN